MGVCAHIISPLVGYCINLLLGKRVKRGRWEIFITACVFISSVYAGKKMCKIFSSIGIFITFSHFFSPRDVRRS